MKKEVVELYKQGKQIMEISRELSITPYYVKKYLKESGAYVPVKRYSNKDNPEIVEKAMNCYLKEGKSLKEVRKLYDVPEAFLSQYIKNMGEQLRTSEISNRKTSLREDAFHYYTPESVYWAGFIAGDGCVFSRGKRMKGKLNYLTIGLATRDEKHVEDFVDFLKFDGKIQKKEASTYVTVNSRKLVQDLEEKYNINDKKTYSYVPPNNIPRDLKKYFILGLIDADGSFLRHRRNNKTANRKRGEYVYQIGFTGTWESCVFVREFFNSTVNIHTRHKERDNNNYTVLFQGNEQVLRYGNLIYDDISKEFCLQRKYKNYCELKKEYSHFIQ